MIPENKLARLVDRFQQIEAELSSGTAGNGFVKLSKEHAELQPIVQATERYRTVVKQIAEAETLIDDPKTDSDMRSMAEEERAELRGQVEQLERDLKIQLLPKDAADDSSAIVEIRPGTGGDEAALFAADLLGMYQRYAQLQGWKTEMMSMTESELGGIKEAVLEVEGRGAFAKLKFESGVHRVQRVPVTEAQGRIHTSAATVAVLPEAEDVDIEINDKDLRIDVYRAQGAGGQHVNKTESAVRITHLPTGIAVAQQTEKSQHKNKAHAMKLLKAKLYDIERERIDSARAGDRKSQVGSGDRSERIRTYNFPQGRVTDHRINLTLYKLDRIITGDDLSDIVDALVAEDQATKLAAIEAEGYVTDTAALLAEGAKRLAAAGIDSPRAEARILFAHVSPHPDLAERFFALIARRETLEPVAYITGLREFWSLEFDVGPGVLIPRPETETLVEEAIKTFADQKATLEVLDLGTGTGCLPIALLKEYPNAHAIAVDASSAALVWAKRNVEKHGLQQRCVLRESQWTDGLNGTFDLIFSNPPYIDTPTVGTLETDVRAFEPHSALDGGTDGLDAYRALAPRIASHLKQTGRTFVELGAGQAASVGDIFAAAGLETIRVVPDLSGIERCLVAAKRP